MLKTNKRTQVEMELEMHNRAEVWFLAHVVISAEQTAAENGKRALRWILRDRTAESAAEQQIRDLNKQLSAHLTDLAVAKDQACEASRTKG